MPMHTEDRVPDEGHRDKLIIVVDGKEFTVQHPEISGRQVLELAGRVPPDNFIVYWLGRDNVMEDLGLDRKVHIHERHLDQFLTFESDRSYRFEINAKREDWGCPIITEATLRKLAGVGEDFRVWQERKGKPDLLIERGASVDLSEPGIERFFVERIYRVEIINENNGDEFHLEATRRTKIETLIDEMYKKLGVKRQNDDRLRCEKTGEDVYAFAQLTLGQYLEAGHCQCLVWCFVGGTGGAKWL